MAKHVILTIDVAYEYQDGSDIDAQDEEELRDILHDAAHHLADNGLLSADHHAIVSEWSASVDSRD